MKKIGVFLCSLLLVVVLSACGDSDNKGKGKGEDALEITIEGASYILSGEDDGEAIGEEADGGLLLIDLNIKNVSDSSLSIFPDHDIQLYDGDTQMDPSPARHHQLDLASDSNSNIGANKQKQMSVAFDVEKDKEYEINISPKPSDYDTELKDVIVTLDTSEYNNSLAALQDPGKALMAYIETIYFDEDNSDYEKYVSADKSSLQDDALTEFRDSLERTVTSDVSDGDTEKYYESFKQASAEKDEIEVEVKGNANGKAIVILNYKALSFDDIIKKMRDYKEKYRDNNDGFDPEKEDEYALSKFDKVLDGIEAKKGSRELEVIMKEEDGKWTIDDSDMNMSERIMRIFAEGVGM